MTRVDFYVLPERERGARLGTACRLVQKAYDSGQQVLLHVADAQQAQQLDDLLWSFRQGSFIPHAQAGSAEAAAASVVIDGSDAPPAPYQLLINLADALPPCFSRFERVIEIVDPGGAVAAARERWRHYKERGYPLEKIEL
ncbi:MAG TPA: DNA polymerase III subunit chi [Gammaproteobacteria bacterium]